MKRCILIFIALFFVFSKTVHAYKIDKDLSSKLIEHGIYHGNLKPDFTIITESYPPFNYMENGKVKGISVDIFQKILKRIGWKNMEIQILPWDIAYKTALNENNVIIFSLTKTSARENKFKWVGPIATSYWNFYSLNNIDNKKLNFKIHNIDDAKKYSVGAQWEGAIAEYLKKNGFNHINYSDTVPKMVEKLLNYDTQLIAVPELVLYSVLRQMKISPDKVKCVYRIKHSYLYIGFNKNIPSNTIKKFQHALTKIKQTGEYDTIMNEYYDKFIGGENKRPPVNN